MRKLPAMSLAGVLLLLAKAPAMAQGYYPPEPGFDQDQDYGPGEVGAEPGYGGPPPGEEDGQGGYAYPGPGQERDYGDADLAPPYRDPLQRRFGDGFGQGEDRPASGERRRAEEHPSHRRRDHNGQRQRRRDRDRSEQ